MAPSIENNPLVGTSICAVLLAYIASQHITKFIQEKKKFKIEEKEKHSASSSSIIETAQKTGYSPGQSYATPDAVVKYYIKDMDDESYQESPVEIDKKDADTPDEWVPRHKDLVRLTGRHPFNCEPPLDRLYDKGFITPTALHYVRNHGAAPLSSWDDHIVYIGGLAPNPIQLKMKDILALPSHSLPVTLVCCGNRRKEQNMIKQSIGFNWGAAGVATGVWTGARLIDVLKLAGIEGIDNWEEGMHIRFASESEKGGDKLPGGVYGTSVTLEKAVSSIICVDI